MCVPGSHKYHEDIVKTVPKKYIHSEWYKFLDDNKEFMKEKDLKMKRIPMKAGSVILWDSRLAHSSTGWCKDAKKNNRLQVFVCMKPASCLSPEEIKLRQKAYTAKRASRHLPDHISLFAMNPRYYGPISGYIEYNIPESCEMSETEKKLHGLISG